MTEATVLSTDELIDLLRAGKIEEFNQVRPKSIYEISERTDDQAKNMFKNGNTLNDYLTEIGSQKERLDFGGRDLSGLDLHGANLSGIDFGEANFTGANLENTNLGNCDFHLANFTGAKMNEADVYGADFWEANFQGVDVSEIKYLGIARFSEVRGLSPEAQEQLLNALRATWK